MNIKIYTESEKREIIKKLSNQHGITNIPGIIAQRGEERLFLFQGDFSEDDIRKLESCTFIERIGIYFAKIVGEEIKLSIEGSQILQEQITKNIIEINDKEAEKWMMGSELPIKTGIKGFVIVKNNNDFLGAGKASENKIGNFIPKNRRLREKGN